MGLKKKFKKRVIYIGLLIGILVIIISFFLFRTYTQTQEELAKAEQKEVISSAIAQTPIQNFFENCAVITDWNATGAWAVSGAFGNEKCNSTFTSNDIMLRSVDLSNPNISYVNLSFTYDNNALDAGVDSLVISVNSSTDGWQVIFTTVSDTAGSAEFNISNNITLDSQVFVMATCSSGNKEFCSWDSINLTSYLKPDEAPNVNLSAPPSGTSNSTTSFYLSCNASDDYQIKNTTLFVWNSTNNIWNQTTNSTTGTNFNYTFFVNNFAIDNYSWNCWTTDYRNQRSWAPSNFSLNVTAVPTDTCSCPEGTPLAWPVDCSDDCIIKSPCVFPNVPLILSGSGTFTIEADIIVDEVRKDKNCIVYNKKNDGNRLIVKKG